jgi:hypothetical protein
MAWIAKPFLADKEFVLLCLEEENWIYKYCEKQLQDDFDVLLAAASISLPDCSGGICFQPESADEFRDFINSWGRRSAASRVNTLRVRLKAHVEFMTFLACSWKSRKCSIRPLRILDCDDETARGLNTTVAEYLGFSGTNNLERLKLVCDEIMFLTVDPDSRVLFKLLAVTPVQAVVKGVLMAIECHRPVSLATYPDVLWTNRLFVEWAAHRGTMPKSFPLEFATDPEICLAYYRHSGAVREAMLPRMSESLMSSRCFVLQCLSFDPLILNCCKKDFLYDFEVIHLAVQDAIAKDELDGLARTALEHGWEDALVIFAKTIHAKLQAHSAVEAFDDHVGLIYFAQAPAVKPLIGSYLGIVPDANERCKLQVIWRHRYIFFLACGGSITDICADSEFRPKRKREDRKIYHRQG